MKYVIKDDNNCMMLIRCRSDEEGYRQVHDAWDMLYSMYTAISNNEESVFLDYNIKKPLGISLYISGEHDYRDPDHRKRGGEKRTVSITEKPVLSGELYEYRLLYGKDSIVFLPVIRNAVEEMQEILARFRVDEKYKQKCITELKEVPKLDICAEIGLFKDNFPFVHNCADLEQWLKTRNV